MLHVSKKELLEKGSNWLTVKAIWGNGAVHDKENGKIIEILNFRGYDPITHFYVN